MKIVKILIILLLAFPLNGKTNNNSNDSVTNNKDSLCNNKNINLIDTITNKVDVVLLDKITVINLQMDSIISNTVKYLTKESQIFFYITLMKQNDNIYIEITGVLNNNSIFEFNSKGKSDDNYLRPGTKIYGYLERENKDFYILSYPPPYDINNEDFEKLFQMTNEKINLKEEGYNEILIYENPIWLYKYEKHKIKLLKSINDKGFFIRPHG